MDRALQRTDCRNDMSGREAPRQCTAKQAEQTQNAQNATKRATKRQQKQRVHAVYVKQEANAVRNKKANETDRSQKERRQTR